MMALAELRRRRRDGQTLQQIADAAGVSRQAIDGRLRTTARWIDTGKVHSCGAGLYRTIGRNAVDYIICGGCGEWRRA